MNRLDDSLYNSTRNSRFRVVLLPGAMLVLAFLFYLMGHLPGSASAAEVVAYSPDDVSIATSQQPGPGTFLADIKTNISASMNIRPRYANSGRPASAVGDDGSATLLIIAAVVVSFLAAVYPTRLVLQKGSEIKLQLDPANPFRLIGSLGEHTMSVTAGRVAGVTRELDTKISVTTTTTHSSPGSTSAGYTPPSTSRTSSSTSSRTYTHDRFFIDDGTGRETPVHLVDWNVDVRDGHMVSVVRVPDNDGGQTTVFMLNHSTDRKSWSAQFFKDAAAPSAISTVGCLVSVVGLPFIFIPVAAAVLVKLRTNGAINKFLPPKGPGMGGLQPLIDALIAAAPDLQPDTDTPAITGS